MKALSVPFLLLLLLLLLPLSLAHPLCTVPSCSERGADTSCYVHGPGMSFLTSCSSWHVLSSTDVEPPCSFSCISSCPDNPSERLLASDGGLYCSPCALQKKSCDSGFEITGPLPEEAHKCVAPTKAEDTVGCCDEWGIACAKEGEECCTGGGVASKPKCEKGTTCVLSDFGFQQLEVPNSGYCRAVAPSQHKCEVSLCARLGKAELCLKDADMTTCGSWGTSDRGNTGPSCVFECDECMYGNEKVLASNGEEYCSVCELEKAACEAAFAFHGPVEQQKQKAARTKTPEPKPQTSDGYPSRCQEPISTSDAAYCCNSIGVSCVPAGGQCSTAGGTVPPPACEKGSICVLYDFGFAALDVPNAGTCREVSPEQQTCGVPLCAKLGKEQLCGKDGEVTSCAAWGKTDRANPGPDCNFECSECLHGNEKVTASNGENYCSVCELEKASCASGFELYGPVEKERPNPTATPKKIDQAKCEGYISPSNVNLCCKDHGIGCIPAGKLCSTAGGMIPVPPCGSGLVCVLTDYGFPALDVPNQGTCREVSPEQPECTVTLCARLGKQQICAFDGGISTCGAWGTPARGNSGPNCSFACSSCMHGNETVIASDGETHCSMCELEKASCSSGFRVFGPMEDVLKTGDEELNGSAEPSEEPEMSLEPEISMEALLPAAGENVEGNPEQVAPSEGPLPLHVATVCFEEPIPKFAITFCCEKFNLGCKSR